MADLNLEPIVKRIRHLCKLISSGGLETDSSVGTSKQLVGQEGLLDALQVLYDECNNDQLKKEENVKAFIEKFRSTLHDLRKLRVNLNDFEQKKVIGKGHFGVVQVVREKATGSVYALKSLRKSDTLSQQHVPFYEERDIMAKATSPWITKLQYAFQDDQQLYLVMEFHPGGDLLSLLDRYDGTFSEEMTRFYLAEITLAVHAVHTMGYVHRDVKPDNILIDRCGHIKLADFGSSAKLTSSGGVKSRMPAGTPDYIAPEVLQSLNEKAGSVTYGIECDLWSLGIIAYEMCYGTTPFSGDKVVTTYSNIMNHKKMLSFPEDADTSASESLKDLIRGLLEESTHRLNHSAILQHKFFLLVNWNDIRNSPPPFVPVVNSVDDTSNFEEFENERRLPNVDAFRTRQGFTGRNLPFIGFTYNRGIIKEGLSSVSPSENISVLDETIREPCHLEAQLKAQRKENHELKLQLESAKEGRTGDSVEHKLLEAKAQVEYLEKERKRLEDEKIKKEREAALYRRDLAMERSDRAKTESQAIDLVRDMTKKLKKEEAEKREALVNQIKAFEEEVAYRQSQHEKMAASLVEREKEFKVLMAKHLSLKKSYESKVKEKQPCNGDCQMAKEAEQKVNELVTKLEVEKEKKDSTTRNLEEVMKEKTALEEEMNKKLLTQKSVAEEEVEELQKKCRKSEEGLASSQDSVNTMKVELGRNQKQIYELEQHLGKERSECSRLRNKLKQLSDQLNESQAVVENLDTSHSRKFEEQEKKVRELEAELKSTMSDKVNLQSQLTLVTTKEGEHKSKITELELLLNRLNETVLVLESKESTSEACKETYQAKLQLLETQLESARQAHEEEKEKVEKLSEELRQTKKDLSDSKLDIRVVQRDAKSSQDTIVYLRERSKEQRDLLNEKEAALKKFSEAEEALQKKIAGLGMDLKAQQDSIEKMNMEHQQEKLQLQAQIKKTEEINKSSEALQKKLREAHQQLDTAKLEKRGLETQIRMVESAREESKQEKAALKEEIKDLQGKLQKSEQVITELKQLCTELDEELTLMGTMTEKVKAHELEEAKHREEKEKLEADLKAARAAINEEKSLKLFQEKKVKELENRLSSMDDETDEQIDRLNEQLKESTRINEELHNQIESMETNYNEVSDLMRTFERDYVALKSQYNSREEEIAGHIQYIHTLKDSNFKLTEGLEEAISKGEIYKAKIEEVERQMSDQQALHEDENIRRKGTIDQQIKLIDFLQAKAEHPKKRKNLKGKLFGGKDKETKDKENLAFTMPHQYWELESLLSRERSSNKELQEQLNKARAEIVALRANGGTLDNRSLLGTPRTSRQTLSQPLTPRPARTPQNRRILQHIADPANIQDSVSKQRMRHNIPHRWQTGLQMRAIRCTGCLDSIPFARSAVKCQECSIIAHTKCASELPSTCGLPVQYAEHYSKGWTSDSPVKIKQSDSSQRYLMQGWVKMPKSGMACWESRYVCIEIEDVLVFTQEPTAGLEPTSRISLCRSGYCTTVISAVPRSELPKTSNVDLPYVLKVEVRPKSASGDFETLYLMTTNFEEKQTWVSALEGVVLQLTKREEESNSQNECMQHTILLSMGGPSPLDVNTAVYLNKETVLVGAAEGLYSFAIEGDGTLKSRSRIEGLNNLHQILVVEKADVAVFIAGKENFVFVCDLPILASLAAANQVTKPTLSATRIEPLQECHLLASGTTKSGQTFICAAATDRISILEWKELEGIFKICRQYSTQEPCSCLHFTQASLIVGAEKFYEIDLKSFEIEEFLDESDTSLAYAIYGCTQMSSYPVAILQVSKPGKYEEYLLCFYEFAVFVDPCGQRSREHDIKFTRLPIAIVFRNPYLYIIHQNAVEVIEVRADSFTKVTSDEDSDCDTGPAVRNSSRNIVRPSYLGTGPSPESILVVSRCVDKIQLIQISASFPDEDLSTTWGTMPCFSTTIESNSDVASIANSSLTSADKDLEASRHVHFRQSSSKTRGSQSKSVL